MSGAAEARAWVLSVHLHDARFHGMPEWPPSPARVFQALVAGAARDGVIPADAAAAFTWLEGLEPPVIAAPHQRPGEEVSIWVPNNDLDALGGDPDRVSEIRVPKRVRPRLIEGEPVFHYVWWTRDSPPPALDALALRLHCLGRGVDQAWARGVLLDAEQVGSLLDACQGVVFRPTPGGTGQPVDLACPTHRSFETLERRYRATLQRFVAAPDEPDSLLFVQPPRAMFRAVPYDAPPRRMTFELRDIADEGGFRPWAQTRVVGLVEWIRDGMANRLRAALPAELGPSIERGLVGRDVPGVPRLAASRRVRIVPLPSVGHRQVDRAIRRLVVEVPAGCPLRADDVAWSASGLEHGERLLLRSAPDRMLHRYGFGRTAKAWRTVTPVVLPDRGPSALTDEAARRLGGRDRISEENATLGSLIQALRHAGFPRALLHARLRREPWTARGAPAQDYARGTRFGRDRLWHVELEFTRAIAGPLVIGDGRFLGLGILEPVELERRRFSFEIRDGWTEKADARRVATALRRAVMARAQAVLGEKPLPTLLSGHEADGTPALGHRHLRYACDSDQRHLHVIPPAAPYDDSERVALATLEEALEGFTVLRAGRDGLLRLAAVPCSELAEVGKAWRSVTPYAVLRHRRVGDARLALEADVQEACMSAGLPRPAVTVDRVVARPGNPVEGILTLRFASRIDGPLLLGRSSHLGGGYFRPIPEPEA